MVLCEKSFSEFSSNIYVLRPPESEKTGFIKVSVYLFLIIKNTIENPKFNFLTIIQVCEIRKKRRFAKLFISIRSTNFV